MLTTFYHDHVFKQALNADFSWIYSISRLPTFTKCDCSYTITPGIQDKALQNRESRNHERRKTAMTTWNDYKDHVRKENPEIGRDMDEAVEKARIIAALIDRRRSLGLSQRDLAQMCGLPHSSVARIESGASSPNLTTLLKILQVLELTLTVEPVEEN